jgi:RimJ/RimL family protein N-acetyltransferase
MSSKINLGEVPHQIARSWRNDPSIWKWCRQHTFISEDEHEAWRKRIAGDPSIKMLGVWAAPGSVYGYRPVGVCGLTSIDRVNQRAEFSLYIAPGEQGKGYGRTALIELLRHGFCDHNLQVIWGETFDGNPALKMFEAVGMTKEATLRQRYFRDGRFIDVHIISMLRGEYDSRYQ